jgi:hypothetical protein
VAEEENGQAPATPVLEREPSAVPEAEEGPLVATAGPAEPPPPKPAPPRPFPWRRLAMPTLIGALVLIIVVVLIRPWPTPPPSPPALVLGELASLSIKAGEAKLVPISVRRNNCTDPICVSFRGLPPQIVIGDVNIPPDHEIGTAEVMVLPDAPPGAQRITVVARADDGPVGQESATITVVGPPCYHLPPGGQRAEGVPLKAVPVGDRCYYERIDVVRGGIPVRFILIPQGEKEDIEDQEERPEGPVPTFYIMEDKVWLELFESFVKGGGEKWPPGMKWEKLRDSETPVNKDVEQPVMGVDWDTAGKCARWLGGVLPSLKQWDKAAGRFWKDRGEGPFKGTLPGKEGEFAINRREEGTMRRGGATHDISPSFGVRDMSGNGFEWTSHKEKNKGPVTLRGMAWKNPTPFQFEQFKSNKLDSEFADTPSEQDGFRVVFQP